MTESEKDVSKVEVKKNIYTYVFLFESIKALALFPLKKSINLESELGQNEG